MRLLASELRLGRRSLLAWAVAVVALVALVVAFFPQVRDNPELNSLYADMSPGLQALLGGSDLTSPVGYLNTQVFAFFLPAVLLVFGMTRGASALAGEEEGRTLDLLMAQPIDRRSVYVQKAAAVAVGLSVLTAATWLPLVLLNGPVQLALPVVHLAAVCVQMGLFCLALSLAAQAVAAFAGRRSTGLAVVSGYAFVSYLVNGLSGSVSWLAHLRPLSMWRWYLGNDPLASGFGAREVLVLVAVCALAVAAGAALFARRDLRA